MEDIFNQQLNFFNFIEKEIDKIGRASSRERVSDLV